MEYTVIDPVNGREIKVEANRQPTQEEEARIIAENPPAPSQPPSSSPPYQPREPVPEGTPWYRNADTIGMMFGAPPGYRKADSGQGALAGVQGMADTATFGLGTNIAAGLQTGYDVATGDERFVSDIYDSNLNYNNQVKDQLQSNYPSEYDIGQFGMMGLTALAPTTSGKSLLQGAQWIKNGVDKSVQFVSTELANMVRGVRVGTGLGPRGGSSFRVNEAAADLVEQFAPKSVADIAVGMGGAALYPGRPIIAGLGSIAAKNQVVDWAKRIGGKQVGKIKRLVADSKTIAADMAKKAGNPQEDMFVERFINASPSRVASEMIRQGKGVGSPAQTEMLVRAGDFLFNQLPKLDRINKAAGLGANIYDKGAIMATQIYANDLDFAEGYDAFIDSLDVNIEETSADRVNNMVKQRAAEVDQGLF